MAQPDEQLWGKALTLLREVVRGWTQRQLAEAARVNRNSLSDYEAGRTVPSVATLRRLLLAMDVSPSVFHRTLIFLQEIFAEDRLSSMFSPEDPAHQSIERIVRRFISNIEGPVAESTEAIADGVRMALLQLTHETRAFEARERAPGLWERLLKRPADERFALVRAKGEFRSWALVELICTESRAAAAASPEQAIELADLAVQIAALLPGTKAWRSRVEALAWAHLGNARRALGNDLKSTAAAFAQFRRLWEAGASSDPGRLLSEALVLGLEASFRRDNRELPASLALLNHALEVDRGEGFRTHLLVSLSRTFEEMGNYDDAITTLQQAAPLIEDEGDPAMLFHLYQNWALYLCHLGHHRDAALMLEKVQALVEALGAEIHRLRVCWLEAKVAAGLGRLDEAEQAFLRVKNEFAAREMAYDTALVTMELAALYASQQGRGAEVRRLARESAAVFTHQGVHAEARRALELFREAAEEELLTVELADRIVRYLTRARHDPALRFEAAA